MIFLLNKNLFKKSYWILIVLFLLGFVIRFSLWQIYFTPNELVQQTRGYWIKIIYAPTYNRLDGLLVGVSIAAIYQFLPKIWGNISRFGNYLLIVGVLILTGAYFFCTELSAFSTTVIGFPMLAVGYGFLVAGAISPDSFLYKWNSKITTLIATLSYGIYLSHKGIIHMIQEIFSNWGVDRNSNLMLLVCMAFCVLIAWLLHLTIEKPFMKIRDRFIQQKIILKKNKLVKNYN